MGTHNTKDPETWSEPPAGTTSEPPAGEKKPGGDKKDDEGAPPQAPRRPIAEPERPEPKRR